MGNRRRKKRKEERRGRETEEEGGVNKPTSGMGRASEIEQLYIASSLDVFPYGNGNQRPFP